MDKVSGIATQHIHWLTNTRTREDMINRMGEAMLDKTIEIRNRHTINEMRDFGRYEGEIKAAGIDNNDDMVCANCIAICALHQSGKRQEWAESSGIAGEGAKHAHLLPKAPAIYAVFNQFGVQVEQCASEAAGWKRIDDIGKQHGIPNLHNQWKVVPLAVGKWNTIWSPAWDSTGAEHELQSVHGLSSRDQMANPDAVNRMRQLIHMRAKFGDERSMMGSDTDTDTATDYSEIGVGDDD
jgi:hypothetical protein